MSIVFGASDINSIKGTNLLSNRPR